MMAQETHPPFLCVCVPNDLMILILFEVYFNIGDAQLDRAVSGDHLKMGALAAHAGPDKEIRLLVPQAGDALLVILSKGGRCCNLGTGDGQGVTESCEGGH